MLNNIIDYLILLDNIYHYLIKWAGLLNADNSGITIPGFLNKLWCF